MAKESKYGLPGCCQVCDHNPQNSGLDRTAGCGGSKYPECLCPENVCRLCEYLFEYADDFSERLLFGECTFYGKLQYEDAMNKLGEAAKERMEKAFKDDHLKQWVRIQTDPEVRVAISMLEEDDKCARGFVIVDYANEAVHVIDCKNPKY